MSRKQDKKRKSISSVQKQRHKNNLRHSLPEKGEVDCRARETATPSKSTPPPPATVPQAPLQTSRESTETITVPVLLTIDQLCTWLNLSRSTIHRLDKAGDLPGRVLIGRQVRYHRPAIESWILKGLTQ